METYQVSSSSIQQVGYDSDTSKLTVWFNSGKKYEYNDVPKEEYQKLIGAASVGSHFNSQIKTRFTGKPA